jgi:hypothetical protein
MYLSYQFTALGGYLPVHDAPLPLMKLSYAGKYWQMDPTDIHVVDMMQAWKAVAVSEDKSTRVCGSGVVHD